MHHLAILQSASRVPRDVGFAFPGPRDRNPCGTVILLALGGPDPALQEGIADWVREHDWELDLSFCPDRPGVLPERCAGVLATVHSRRMAEWLAGLACPAVQILGSHPTVWNRLTRQVPSVRLDTAAAGRMGAAHLLGIGKRAFVFCRSNGNDESAAVCRGFVEGLTAVGHGAVILDFHADHPDLARDRVLSRDIHRRWLVEKIGSLPLPAALMAEDDRSALEILSVARELGLQVPDELAILGNQNQCLQLRASPLGISSVDADLYGAGHAAAGLLADIVTGIPPRSIIVAPKRVEERCSTAISSCRHVGVDKALKHIREHFSEPLTVAGVAKEAGLTPRGLQKALRQETGLTLVKEITRLRLDAAMRLLKGTELTLEEIAVRTGLANAKNLCRLFQRCHGVTPKKWRDARRLSPK